MATQKLKLLFLLLIIIGLGGCGQKDPPPVKEPPIEVPGDTVVMPPQTGEPVIFDKDIIGKWELIAEGPEEDQIKSVESNGDYKEFSPDGEYRYFSSVINGFGNAKRNYQLDSTFLYLYYVGNADNDYIYEFAFINKDTLKLTYVQGIKSDIMDYPTIQIHKRIK
ncbi:hypothetical protein FACS1894181_07960 [Bacteroidia bacterium]|nr:hypothetical protein FACS1894181_07960 [Bacteroidia bacterium]